MAVAGDVLLAATREWALAEQIGTRPEPEREARIVPIAPGPTTTPGST